MKQATICSLKVWLTTLFIAPLLSIILMGILSDGLFGLLFWYTRILLSCFLPSLLGALFLLVSVYFLRRIKHSVKVKKFYFTCIIIFFTVASFFLFDDIHSVNKEFFYFSVSYCLVNVAGVLFYNIRHSVTRNPKSAINI